MQKTPHVVFSYDQKKDIENIKIGLDVFRNGRKADGTLTEIVKKYGENPSDEQLAEFCGEFWNGKENIQTLIINQMQEYWNSIEEIFFIHFADRMQIESFFGVEIIRGYLSIRWGSGYNSEENWFAFSSHSGTLQNTKTAMHEVMHVFFHKQWWDFCTEQGVSNKNIWDIKEAVTVLLNLWFKNQLIDLDMGYEEHTELRHNIKQWFLDSRDFKKTLTQACEYMKIHPEKSPVWNK